MILIIDSVLNIVIKISLLILIVFIIRYLYTIIFKIKYGMIYRFIELYVKVVDVNKTNIDYHVEYLDRYIYNRFKVDLCENEIRSLIRPTLDKIKNRV